jgi:hypothetical protein
VIAAYFWWWPMMAEVVPDAGGISPEMVGAIVAAVVAALLGGGIAGKKITESRTTIANDPVRVAMAEDFVTRREFERLEVLVAVNATKSEGYLRQANEQMSASVAMLSKALERQNERLVKKIEEFGSSAYHGRKAIWDQVNEQRERVSRMEVHADTGDKIEKLAGALHALAGKDGAA